MARFITRLRVFSYSIGKGNVLVYASGATFPPPPIDSLALPLVLALRGSEVADLVTSPSPTTGGIPFVAAGADDEKDPEEPEEEDSESDDMSEEFQSVAVKGTRSPGFVLTE